MYQKVLKITFIIGTVLLFCQCTTEEQDDNIMVTFEVDYASDSLALSETITMAGNHELLGQWNPAHSNCILRKEGGKYRASIQLKKGTELAYKYTRGSWDTEETSQEGYIPSDKKLSVQNDTTIIYTINNWKDVTFKIKGQVTGDLRYHRDFPVKGLPDRDVLVWLPPNYETASNQNYPVLYMHDAQNVFDPKTSTLQRDWEIDETLTQLITEGKVEPVIVVAINCTTNRGEEYAYGASGKLYQDFVCHQLRPFINKTYRTKTEAKHTASMGASMGGLISFILPWEHPDIFSKGACLSPAF